MKQTPNAILAICATVIILGVLTSIVYLTANGKDAESISRFVNTLLNFLGLIGIGVTGVAAGAAAKSSHEANQAAQKTVDQTNGPLTARLGSIEQSLARLTPESTTQTLAREQRESNTM